jgi:hypothetical protein
VCQERNIDKLSCGLAMRGKECYPEIRPAPDMTRPYVPPPHAAPEVIAAWKETKVRDED